MRGSASHDVRRHRDSGRSVAPRRHDLFLPLTALIPAIVELGAGSSRTFLMRRYVKMEPIVPFVLGSGAGAIAGARVTLSPAALQAFLGALAVLWMPNLRSAARNGRVSQPPAPMPAPTALMIAGTVLGNWIGRRALDRMPERMFRTVFQLLLCLLALRLLLGAALESDL